jgi:PAS domain S-box-containing protein
MDPNQDKPPVPPDAIQATGEVALWVVLVYAVFAGLWILLSDETVALLFRDPDQLVMASTIKGWLFVAVTSLLLFGFVRRRLDQARLASRREHEALAEKARALQLLAAIAENSSDAIFAKDLQGRYLLFNRETARIVDRTAQEALGWDDTALFPPDQAAVIRANDRRVLDEQRINTYEEALTTKDGERIYLATKGPLHDVDGRIIGLFGIARDITERKQAEVELRRSIDELERFNRVAIDRELGMIRLKQQVNELSRQLGQAPPYAIDFGEAARADGAQPDAGASRESR